MKLPRASTPVAVASAASLAMQLVLGVLLLRGFSPVAVGEFSVVAQIAFYWMTLALAQGQLKLLADVGQPPARALRQNLLAALGRWLLLLPLGWAAIHLSGASLSGAAAWATLLALLQLGWYLAQAFTLRAGDTAAMAWVRVLPPAATLLAVGAFAVWQPQAGATALLLAAAGGYALGWCWLWPARRHTVPEHPPGPVPAAAKTQADDRSTALRMAHTLADALVGTAILLVWQRMHGAEQAGYLAVLLRILGFVPAVTHAAWAQVLLAQASGQRRASVAAGAIGATITALLGLGCALALWSGRVDAAWTGLSAYLLPVVCWQAAACVLAALSHLPFHLRRARDFSVAAIGYDLLQLALLCLPWWLGIRLAPGDHIAGFAWVSALALVALSLWVARGRTAAH